MNVKSISQLYIETHTVSHVRTRLVGDSSVNNAINCTLNREGSWSTKKSTTVECEATFTQAVHVNTVGGEVPEFTGPQAASLANKFNNNVKNAAKAHIDKQHEEQCKEKLKTLAVQGKNLELAAAENSDFLWKSHLYDMRAGTMTFLLNAAIDTLPSAANLKRWKKSQINANFVLGDRQQIIV